MAASLAQSRDDQTEDVSLVTVTKEEVEAGIWRAGSVTVGERLLYERRHHAVGCTATVNRQGRGRMMGKRLPVVYASDGSVHYRLPERILAGEVITFRRREFHENETEVWIIARDWHGEELMPTVRGIWRSPWTALCEGAAWLADHPREVDTASPRGIER